MLAFGGALQGKSLHPDYLLLRGDVQTHGDWIVGCDNQADCTMLGFPPAVQTGEDMADIALEIRLAGPADTAPKVALVPLAPIADAAAAMDARGPFVLNLEFSFAAILVPHGYARADLAPIEAQGVLMYLGEARALAGISLIHGRVIARFPQAGFGQGFAAIEARRAQLLRGLADQATDDFAGERPGASLAPAARPRRRITAEPAMASGAPPVPAHAGCTRARMQDVEQFRFRNGAALWRYDCGDGAATGAARSFWGMADQPEARVQPLSLPDPRDGPIAAGMEGLPNAVFDWDFGVLRAYAFQEGRPDCGIFRAWAYTDKGWHLIERREMPLCRSLEPADWIRTHFTPTIGPGPQTGDGVAGR